MFVCLPFGVCILPFVPSGDLHTLYIHKDSKRYNYRKNKRERERERERERKKKERERKIELLLLNFACKSTIV